MAVFRMLTSSPADITIASPAIAATASLWRYYARYYNYVSEAQPENKRLPDRMVDVVLLTA
jgi:hypothetical protein